MRIDIEVDAADLLSFMERFSSQAPFAVSKAINDTVNEAQTSIRGGIADRFTLRRKEFVERTIKRERADFATKTRWEGSVRIDPSRDFLAKFEEGGQKRGRTGGDVFVPIIRKGQPNLIIRRTDPLHLSKLPKVGSKAKRRGYGIFAVKGRDGNVLILQRRGTDDVRVLYAAKDSVPIRDTLRFGETASKVADRFADKLMAQMAEVHQWMK